MELNDSEKKRVLDLADLYCNSIIEKVRAQESPYPKQDECYAHLLGLMKNSFLMGAEAGAMQRYVSLTTLKSKDDVN